MSPLSLGFAPQSIAIANFGFESGPLGPPGSPTGWTFTSAPYGLWDVQTYPPPGTTLPAPEGSRVLRLFEGYGFPITWSQVSQGLGEAPQPYKVYELRVKVRNNWPFALLLKAGQQTLVKKQYTGSGPDNLWHEQVLKYQSESNPPSGNLQIVLLAGTAPPEDGGTDQPGQTVAQDDQQQQQQAISESVGGQSESSGGPEEENEPTDGMGYVRFDDVRLTKRPYVPHYGFQGREPDFETGLIYFRRNYADPKVGQFLSEDSIRYDLDNLRRFEFNNPENLRDPFGLAAFSLGWTAVPAGMENAFSFRPDPLSRLMDLGRTASFASTTCAFSREQVAPRPQGVTLLGTGNQEGPASGPVTRPWGWDTRTTSQVLAEAQGQYSGFWNMASAHRDSLQSIYDTKVGWYGERGISVVGSAPQWAQRAQAPSALATSSISAVTDEHWAQVQQQWRYPNFIDQIRLNGPQNEAQVTALRAAAIVESNAHRSLAGQIFFNTVNSIAEVAPEIAIARASRGQSGGSQMMTRRGHIHGNSLLSPRTAYLYGLETRSGDFLEWGVTQDMAKRYSKGFMAGKKMFEFARGSWVDMLTLERQFIETQPGPLNFEPWAGARLGGQP